MGIRYIENGYSDSLDGVIVALCKDYCRRREAGEKPSARKGHEGAYRRAHEAASE